MTQFILKITLGNDAMQTGYDVARSLRHIANILQDSGELTECDSDRIMDYNGNTVGSWKVK